MRLIPHFLFFLCLLTLANISMARDNGHGLFAYPTAKGFKVGAVFGTLPTLPANDVLISATSPICDHIEIHTMSEDNGIFRMRKVENLSTKKNIATVLKTDGYHLMLMGLTSQLNEKQTFQLTLTFKNAGEKTVTIPVHSRSKKKD